MALICEWAGLTRLAVSWGTLVCSGVDVYSRGKKLCFILEGHGTHTAFWGHEMLNTVCDDKENVVLHMAFSSSKMLSHFHFLLRTPDNSASLRHGDFTFSALFRAGINIRPEWSNRKWTGVKTPMIHWEAFEIQPLKSHSADVWARKWLQSFNSVYRTVPHWGTAYSAEVLRETRSYSLPVLTADVCEHTVTIPGILKVGWGYCGWWKSKQ